MIEGVTREIASERELERERVARKRGVEWDREGEEGWKGRGWKVRRGERGRKGEK
jgi:hypothetical protein